MEIVNKGCIDGVDWHLVRMDESGISMSGPAALYYMELKRPGYAWTARRPFDDTAVLEGEWDQTVEREARIRIRQLLAETPTI
ncbi:MAG: hypothetical protein WC700_02045 [Gemmatimonadaceae bacterium]|jgi:hypothetical protein